MDLTISAHNRSDAYNSQIYELIAPVSLVDLNKAASRVIGAPLPFLSINRNYLSDRPASTEIECIVSDPMGRKGVYEIKISLSPDDVIELFRMTFGDATLGDVLQSGFQDPALARSSKIRWKQDD